MLTRLRMLLVKLLVKTPVRIALGLVAAYLLFGWFGFEPLVKWAAPKFIADKSQHRLTIAEAKFDPLTLSVRIKGLKLAELDGKPLLAFDELFVDFAASSLFRFAYTFDDIRLTGPRARVELLADGRLNWSNLIEALKDKEETPDQPLPRLLVRRIALERGRVDVADRKVGFETGFDPLALTLTELSTLPDDKGAYAVSATNQMGARIRWKGDLTLKPVLATGELAIDQIQLDRLWPYLEHHLNMAPPQGAAALSLTYRAGWADKKLSLLIDKLGVSLEKLSLSGKGAQTPVVSVDRFALNNARFDLGKRTLDIGEIALNGGRVNLNRDKNGRLDVQDWFVVGEKPVETNKPQSAAKNAAPGPAWRINLASFALDGLGLHLTDTGFTQPLVADVGNVKLAFSAHAEAGGTQPVAVVEGLGLDVSGIRLLAGKQETPLFVMGGASLSQGRIDLANHQATAGKAMLSNGKIVLLRDAQGQIALMKWLQRPPSVVMPVVAPVAAPAAPWRWQVAEAGLTGFEVGARDESVQPAAGLTLIHIAAQASGLSENMAKALPVKLAFQVKEGGAFQAEGKVTPAKPAADIHLKLTDLALTPVQPYLGQAANLALASGRVSAQGRVKFDGKLDFSGGFDVADLLVNEARGESGSVADRFLSWKRLSSDSVHYTPEGMDIGELKLDSLGAKLVIHQDKTTNLKTVQKTVAAPVPKTKEAGASSNTSPRLTIDRIRVENGALDFADYSLSLPFGTHIHSLKGAFNGISTQPGSKVQLELDGQVDDYGLARAAGLLDLFNPTGFMDIKTVFRNVEMNRLTPYTATFAGYKIASGKLSLDLEYKIKDRQLLGENQIIMDQLTLGERLEGPDIKHLPLELAIAILKDSDGKIDLGLPVSGSLDDPQFSYGRIIWKAIGNILTKIVTAPFRALGALFGGNGEKLEKVAFEAGEAALTPPEKEKFKQIATILGKRPGLALTVHPAWSAGIDRPAMKEAQLRRAVAEKSGVKLAEGEDAGPVSTASPKGQVALEALFAARFGDETWRKLQEKWQQANPGKKSESGAGKLFSRLKTLFKPEEPLSPEDAAQLQGADLYALLYQRLLEREVVSDDLLASLGQRRAQSAVEALAAAGAPMTRVTTGAAEKFAGEGREVGREVPLRLELGVVQKTSSPP